MNKAQTEAIKQLEEFMEKELRPPPKSQPNINPIAPLDKPAVAMFICHDCSASFKVDAGIGMAGRIRAQQNVRCNNCMGERVVMMCLTERRNSRFM